MKNSAIAISFVLLVFACKQPVQDSKTMHTVVSHECSHDSVNDGLFIHITESYKDPHRVLMPLKMANMMADDKDVLVYMDIHAVELLAKDAKDLQYADFESVQTYIKSLVDKKVGVYACPTCLKIAGINPDNLLEGVQIAQKEKFFNFTKGRIITLDY
jgi:predicted peroxiredoxin